MTTNETPTANGGVRPDELYHLYQNAAANLAALKNRQWQVLVLFTAPVAFLIYRADQMSIITKGIMTAAIVVGAVATVGAIFLSQRNMEKEREILSNIYQRFGDDFRECRKVKGDVQKSDCFEILFVIGIRAYLIVVVFSSTAVFWNWPWPA